jgi:hypothetical protein
VQFNGHFCSVVEQAGSGLAWRFSTRRYRSSREGRDAQ